MPPSMSNPRVGLLAGWGNYPLVIADAIRAQGADIVGLGVKDHVLSLIHI